jgi:ATP-dependent DNA helicase DinG
MLEANVVGAELTVASFFKEGGLLSQVKKGFTEREGQAELSELILQAMAEKKNVIADAPTGFGKSLALLVPAVIAAIREGKRVVVSTGTLALQDQYFLKDLPTIHKAVKLVGYDFTYAVAKGKSNYACKAKFIDPEEDELSVHDNRAKYSNLPKLTVWAKEQDIFSGDSGDIASVPFSFPNADWRSIGADEDCEKKACPFYGQGRKEGGETECFIYQAQKNYMEADIVVANHTLVLLDALIGSGAILGRYDLLLFDEGHEVVERASDSWGMEFKPRTISNTMKLCNKILEKSGVELFEDGFLQYWRDVEDALFQPFIACAKQPIALKAIPDKTVVPAARAVAAEIVTELKRLNRAMSKLIVHDENDPTTLSLTTCKEKVSKITSGLSNIFGENIDEEYKDNWLTFLTPGFNKKEHTKYVSLNLKPIEIAPLMRSLILEKEEITTTVFISATMQVKKGFGFMKRELGLVDPLEFLGKSPFDFYNNVVAYFPKHLPDNTDSRYEMAMAKEIAMLLNHSNGRALVLFTSNYLMETITERVKPLVKFTILMQGDSSKNALIEEFKEDIHSCLFATKSFFTGVDIPGEALSNVILTKAPFRVPSDPMFKAKCEKIEERGYKSFDRLAMPLMLFDVLQGFGRLIRTTADHGMFCFLDSRANKKAYGGEIKNALPKMRILERLDGG